MQDRKRQDRKDFAFVKNVLVKKTGDILISPVLDNTAYLLVVFIVDNFNFSLFNVIFFFRLLTVC
jgi:hypothetical protein